MNRHRFDAADPVRRGLSTRFVRPEFGNQLEELAHVWQDHRNLCHTAVAVTQECGLTDPKLDLLQGTLDLMVLQTLAAMGEQHGYGIARRIEQVSGNEVLLNQGTIYASLVRLQQRGWIDARWGVSGNNRKAKFYRIKARGRKQLAEDASHWRRLSAVIGRVLAMEPDGE